MIVVGWPAKPLWPNFRSRSHWPKTRALKAARTEAHWAAKAAKVGIPAADVPVVIRATFNPPDRRSRDYDNCGATLKPYLDGLADALGVNDSAFRPLPPVIGEKVAGGKLTLEIVDADFKSFGQLARDIVARCAGGDA